MCHIIERHYHRVQRHPNTGKFAIPLTGILTIIRDASHLDVFPINGSPNLQRSMDTESFLGFDRNGLATSVITIITDTSGNIITAFPGRNKNNIFNKIQWQKNKKYIETSLWFKEEITDPYQIIAAFFDFGSIPMHRQDIHDMMKAACSIKVWKKCSEEDLAERFERLESLVNAAYIINKKGQDKRNRLEIRKEDIYNPNLYFGNNDSLSIWEYFPRMLSVEEFADPFKVFKKFFNYKSLEDWKETMNGLLQYTATTDTIETSGEFFDTYSIHRQLVKLIEASHLIDVREIIHIEGRIKYKLKKKLS